MKRFLPASLCLLLLAGCQYGPATDRSRFKSAALVQNGNTIAFTAHDLVYRPAKGMGAFPDGGVPKYVEDRSFLCLYDRKTGTLSKRHEEKNTLWTNGSGALHIVTGRGNALLVSQSGQLRKDLATIYTRHHLIDLSDGSHETFDLAADLAKHGRDPGALYLIDDAGMFMSLTDPLNPVAGKPYIPEIWIRLRGGTYLLAATNSQYQETRAGVLIYWRDRKYYGFEIATRETRELPDYRPQGMKEVNEGVSVPTTGEAVKYGTRTSKGWDYQPIPVTLDDIRKL